MKIERIQIKNIGPYVDENCFKFDVSDLEKRMVLIGGKNGAGKTTLFNAIKICLYGCVAYGYESNNARYYAEVEKLINTNEKLKKRVIGILREITGLDEEEAVKYLENNNWNIRNAAEAYANKR